MKRLLFISHRMPYPPDKGERVRAFQEIVALGRQFEVTVASAVDGEAERAAAAELATRCRKVITAPAGRLRLMRGVGSMLAGRSLTEGFFRNAALGRLLADEAAARPFDLAVCYSSGVLPIALATPAGARVADLVDADSAKWLAYGESSHWPMSWLYAREGRAVARLEQLAAEQCDAVAVVSPAEARAAGLAGPKLVVARNGVDSQYFAPRPMPEHAPPSIVFTGTMSYRPNIEAVCWFVREVWPALQRQAKDLTFVIVGRDPAPAVQKLTARRGVMVTGEVDDVRPYLAAAVAAVVPLGIARGVQNKILEAMAMGRAVVASPAATVAFDILADNCLLQADTPDQWRRHVLDLLHKPPWREGIEQAARAAATGQFNWDKCLAPLVDRCVQLAGGEPDAAAAAENTQ